MTRVEPVYLSLVAVAGTLLGAAVTHVLQNRQVNLAARADALMGAALAILDAADREAFGACTEALRTTSKTFVTAARADLRELA